MKKIMTFITLGFAIATSIVNSLLAEKIPNSNPDPDVRMEQMREQMREFERQLREKALTDDDSLKQLIRLKYTFPIDLLPDTIVDIIRTRVVKSTNEGEIPMEREIKIMELMVREGLVVCEKGITGQEVKYNRSFKDIHICIMGLAVLPDYDVIPLLKECLQNNDEKFRRDILIVYVFIKNVETIPFLKELVEEANFSDQNRSYHYKQLENFTKIFTRQEKHEDVAKINAFLKKVREAEQAKKDAEQTTEEPPPVATPDPENPPPANTEETE